jgi:hypothetical protein
MFPQPSPDAKKAGAKRKQKSVPARIAVFQPADLRVFAAVAYSIA